ncbi:carboxypeptidase S [Hymenopellis radicata]|nr:carboxypeptidase S [Hymenopellis radicata]
MMKGNGYTAGLPTYEEPTAKPKSRRFALAFGLIASVALLQYYHPPITSLRVNDGHVYSDAVKPACPQAAPLVPERNRELWDVANEIIGSEDFKWKAISLLAGAVNIPTETFDEMGPPEEDPRFETRGKLHKYLLESFPLVHATFDLKKVNTYGLIYTWKGKDESLKPILLLAHQDVVPVNPDTVGLWTHPPFSGHFDGAKIWGRGASDDKSGVIGILQVIRLARCRRAYRFHSTTLEILLSHGFVSTRTIILSFGFDEEGGGTKGAGTLAPALLEMYGENSMAFVLDETGSFSEQFGHVFAMAGVTEKGFMNVKMEVDTPGGHSSIPPRSTGIGILSRMVVEFEEDPFMIHLERQTPTYDLFQCFAEYGKDMPDELRATIKEAAQSDEALSEVENILFHDPLFKSLVATTQPVDMIHGGVKSNALPEQAWAVVNHRISTQSSVAQTQKHDTDLLIPLAHRFNLTYTAFGKDVTEMDVPSKGSLTLSSFQTIPPAPVTPSSGKNAAAYELLSGTIKATYNSHRALEGDNIAVTPGMPTGNTDSRYYWSLSENILRYNHHIADPMLGQHTVNEYLSLDAYLEIIRFFTTLILNADESTTL